MEYQIITGRISGSLQMEQVFVSLTLSPGKPIRGVGLKFWSVSFSNESYHGFKIAIAAVPSRYIGFLTKSFRQKL